MNNKGQERPVTFLSFCLMNAHAHGVRNKIFTNQQIQICKPSECDHVANKHQVNDKLPAWSEGRSKRSRKVQFMW